MDKLTIDWGSIGLSSPESKADADASSDQQAKKDKRPAPFSLRLSFEEREQLEQDSGRQSISAYIKACLFDPDKPVKQARGLNPVKDHQALAQVLGLLGSSGLSQRMSELAEAAKVGALPVDEETESAIRRACDDVRIMRRFLLAALGIRDPAKKPDVNESCSSCFARAVANTSTEPPDQEPNP